MSKTAIVILNWNGATDTIECIKSLKSNESASFSIFILDNDSEKEDSNKLENWILNSNFNNKSIYNVSDFEQCSNFCEQGISLIKGKENLGFARGNNLVLKKVYNFFDYCILLNNDTVVTEEALTNMVTIFDMEPEIMVSTCNIRYYSNPDKLWNAGGIFTFYGDRKYFSEKEIKRNIERGNTIINAPFVTGCVLMIRKKVLDEVGLLTEDFFFGEEDFNYCMRLVNKQVKTVSILDSIVYHKIGSSISKAASGDTLLRKSILHFTNRIINQKKFMGRVKWRIWRVSYLSAVWANIYHQTKDWNKANYVYRSIRDYSERFDGVDYYLFNEINSLDPKEDGTL